MGPEQYNVELALPDPSQGISNHLKPLNEKAKEYDASNIQLIHNEYGSYLQADMKLSNDSNKDNDHILALSGFLKESSYEMLVVRVIHLDEIVKSVVIQRADALDYKNNKLEEYKFIQKWKVTPAINGSDLASPNKPQEPEPEPIVRSYPNNPVCMGIIAATQQQMEKAIESYNQSDNNA